jgi:hypothetical protein
MRQQFVAASAFCTSKAIVEACVDGRLRGHDEKEEVGQSTADLPTWQPLSQRQVTDG